METTTIIKFVAVKMMMTKMRKEEVPRNMGARRQKLLPTEEPDLPTKVYNTWNVIKD